MKIAIIPARGGSKRIPKKNIKLFNGKPIISYSIEVAIKSGLFSHIIVSTDDDEVMDVARKSGSIIPLKRPGYLSDDHSETIPVIKHAISEIEEKIGKVDTVCCLYATAPFVTSDRLRQVNDLFVNGSYDYCFPVVEFEYPIQRGLLMDETSKVSMIDPNKYSIRSQDLESCYHDAGQFYFGKRSAWLEEKPIFSSNSSVIVIPRKHAQDIDTPEDWEFSEYLYHYLNHENDQ